MPRQQSIPGTDVTNPVIEDLIERWLEAKEKTAAAKEKEAELDDTIVVKMVELGVPYHPYTDPESGKRKYRIVDTTPRGKSIAARPAPAEDMKADEPTESESTPVEQVTHRKVPRAAAKREIDEVASERKAKAAKAKCKSDLMAQADDAIDGALRPARDWDAS